MAEPSTPPDSLRRDVAELVTTMLTEKRTAGWLVDQLVASVGEGPSTPPDDQIEKALDWLRDIAEHDTGRGQERASTLVAAFGSAPVGEGHQLTPEQAKAVLNWLGDVYAEPDATIAGAKAVLRALANRGDSDA